MLCRVVLRPVCRLDRKNLPMNPPVRLCVWLVALATVAVVCSPVLAQQPAAKASPRYRKLAPGVMLEVDNQRELEETFSRHDVVELLAKHPDFDWVRQTPFQHAIWNLEFKFKPVRMIYIDEPQPTGQMKRQLIWYMVYSVTNKVIKEEELNFKVRFESVVEDGVPKKKLRFEDTTPPPQFGWIQPIQVAEGTYTAKSFNKPIRFLPEFKLEGYRSVKEEEGANKVYIDRVIPLASGPIRLREDRNRKFYTSVEICDHPIQPGETAWGIATWKGVDRAIDRFSVYVQGLTNAYQWQDEEGRYKVGNPIGTGRRLSRKTLKLNFWRPGDEYLQHEKEIRYGVPGEVDYEWIRR